MSEHSLNSDPVVVTNVETLTLHEANRVRVTVEQARTLPIPAGQRSAPVLAHGSLLVKFYAPKGVDQQTPHTRDELYVIIQGSGWFVCGDQRYPFGVSDVLFVPAGVVHRFEDFTDDFCVWVVFYGPEGGEAES
jgi:mannose-6-phosphate isomerase-like protein (cupin superfamily)